MAYRLSKYFCVLSILGMRKFFLFLLCVLCELRVRIFFSCIAFKAEGGI